MENDALCNAVKDKDIEKVQELLTDSFFSIKSNLDIKDENGQFPLMYAVINHDIEILELLVSVGADVNSINNNGQSLLMAACGRECPVKIAELLISKGVDVNRKNNYGKTALKIAILNGRLNIVELLINNGVDVNTNDDLIGESHLWIAIEEMRSTTDTQSKKIVMLLINAGADLKMRNKSGNSLLFDALRPRKDIIGEYDIEVFKLLISKGADIHEIENGKSLLVWAIGFKNCKMAEILISNGIDLNAEDNSGFSALYHTLLLDFNSENREMILTLAKLLISRGADVNIYNHNQSLLIYALDENFPEIAELIIENGADINEKDNYNETPLSVAVKKGFDKITELLLLKGADVHEKIVDNKTLLHLAAEKSNIKIVQTLINKDADVNAKDNFGNTPLHFTSDLEIARILIEAGADLNIKNDNGEIPNGIAIQYGDLGAIESTFKNAHENIELNFSSENVNFNNLVNKYLNLFNDCRKFTKHINAWSLNNAEYSYDLDDALKAVERLSNLNSPISSNLLHILATIKDVRVIRSHDAEYGYSYRLLSFSDIREKATFELRKRGNPSYISEAFLDKNAYI